MYCCEAVSSSVVSVVLCTRWFLVGAVYVPMPRGARCCGTGFKGRRPPSIPLVSCDLTIRTGSQRKGPRPWAQPCTARPSGPLACRHAVQPAPQALSPAAGARRPAPTPPHPT